MLAELLCFGHSRSEVKLSRASARAASGSPPRGHRNGDDHNGGGGMGGGGGGGVAGNIDIALTAPVAVEAYDIADA
jgi:hypothetical protein